MSNPRILTAAAALAALTAPALLAQPGPGPRPEPVRTITQIKGDLYRAENNAGFITHVTVFLVTPEGIILADPISVDFAQWLKGELDRRFDVPVRYVVYSHYHWDHAEGGAAFADTAKFVAHEKMREALQGPFNTWPPPGDALDTNNNGRIDSAEATGGTRMNFPRFDRNGDGAITVAEMYQDIQPPDIVFSERMTLELGGKKVELIPRPPSHSDDMVDMLFPEQRVLFAGDYTFVKRLGIAVAAFDRTPLAQWISSLKTLESLDFDTFVPCHWEAGVKADMVDYRVFLEKLVAGVSQGIREGKSKDELVKTLQLPGYENWVDYERSRPNFIGHAYENLTTYK